MIPAIQELNFPSYATLTHAEVKHDDMGEKNITTQVKINGDITPDFSHDWEVEFQGEKYIMPLRQPQGAKENTSLNSTIDLTFQHWAIYQLKRWMFFTVQPVETGTAVADKYIDDVILNLGDFCNLFGQVLRHYYGDTITIDLNPDWDYKQEASPIAISHSYIWDVLIKLYELFAVRWSIEPNSDSSHYVIKVGYPAEELDHIFEYGFEGGLLKVERQVQSEEIRNMLLGRGGEKNIPKYYFKKSPDEEKWRSDPDWIEELANIYFTNLMPATFRSYVQGWKAAHISKYPGYAAVGESNAYAPWAYRKGYTDSKFDQVEYVKDDESIAKYGPLLGGLDNNEEIYPSIQGSGMDIAVDVEQILSDEMPEQPENDTETSELASIASDPTLVQPNGYAEITLQGGSFRIDEGKSGNLDVGAILIKAKRPASLWDKLFSGLTAMLGSVVKNDYITFRDSVITVTDTEGKQHSASGIPPGEYIYALTVKVQNTSSKPLDIKAECNHPTLTAATPSETRQNTFDIWVKNIWDSSKLSTETNEQYAERVWKPILGDREGGEAAVMFTTGALAISEDYEFKIPEGAWPVYDTSRKHEEKDKDGNVIATHTSHWRIKLAKSDADLESTGLYVPSTQRQGKAGDKFIFIGTEMTHHYVVWAETALDGWKKDQLREKKDIKPTWVVITDRVRLNNGGKPNAIIHKLKAGCPVTLQDKRFIDGSQQETLYLQSIKYTYREPSSDDAALNPDVELILSDKYETVANPVAMIQSDISAIQRQLGSISNIEQIARAVGDKTYIRKDRSDRTPFSLGVGGALSVGGKLAAEGGVQFGPVFAEGITGFGGKVDEKGRAWLESLVLRGFLEVPELRYNRTEVSVGNDWNAPGGGTLEAVEPDRDADGSPLPTGKATLRLEAGELGAVAAGDICMGIWHDSFSPESNSTEDSDDSKGNFRFSGFRTVCFRITEILDAGDNSRFRYALRDESPSYPSASHPSAQMTFVSYGSFTRPDRRTSRYSTRTYTRYLRGVDTWEFGADNVAAQFGDLTNLSVFGFDMEGYSVYLDNVYMKGTVQSVGLARHWIEASAQQVVRHPDGTASPATLTAKGWRKDSTGRVEEHGTVSYLTASGVSGTVPAAGLATRGLDFPVTLRLTGTGVDTGVSLTVAEVRDGADGTPGTYTENLLEGSADFSPLHTGWPPRTDGEWFTHYPDYVSASQTERIDGRPTVRVRKTDSDTTMFVGVRQFIDMSGFEDGEPFTLGFRTLIKDASVFDDSAYAELNFYDEGLNRIRSYGHEIPADTNLGVRTHLFSDTKPKGARHAEAYLFLIHNGEAWFGSPKLSGGVQEEYAWTPSPADLRGKDGDKGDKGDKGDAGAPGAQGADGAVMRTTEWEAGKKYWDGRQTDPQTGVRPLDIVVVASADGLSRSVWLCTMSHTSSERIKPGDGSMESMISWSRFSSLTPISTPLLLADNAKITFLNTQEILIVVDGAVAGRFGGGQTPLWTGGATAATAKFALSNTGKVRFGNDGGQRVELDPSTNGMSIYDGEGRKTEFRGERVADIAGIFKAASLAVSGIVASGRTSSDEQKTKSQRVATVKAATAGNLKVSCTLELNSAHEYAEAEAEVYVTDSGGNTVWADSLSSERGTGPKSKAVNADIHLPAAGTYLVRASLRTRKYDYYAPGSDLSQGPTQTYNSSAGWSGLKVGGAGTVYKAQYLSNGWAIGNGSDSYAAVWEDAAKKMRLEALCGGNGIKVGSDGVRVNHGNGWDSVPRTLLSGWLNWTGSSYQWAWRSTGEGILSGNPQKQAVGKVFIPLTAGMPDPSRLSVQVTGRFTPLETAVGDITASGSAPGITVLLSRGGKAMDSGFLITISEI